MQGAPGQGSGEYGWSDFERDIKDPRYETRSPKYDQNFRQQVDARVRQLGPRRRG